MGGQRSDQHGHFLRSSADGRGYACMAGHDRTAVRVFIGGGCECDADVLRSPAETEMQLILIRHGKTEEFTLWCVRNGKDATEIFKENRDKWANSVLICMDIFCGVVPMGADMRAWRDMTGRLCAYLSSEAETVTRMFCGLEQRLK